MDLFTFKIVHALLILLPVISGSILVDAYPRLSRVLRITGFTVPTILLLTTGYPMIDYQLALVLLTSVVAIGVSIHSEGYYKVIYGLSRYFQLVVDLVLATLLLLFSSSFLIELIIYWFFLDIIVAFIAITMEHGTENLPVASTYIAMCIAPSDIALLTMWAMLAVRYGLFNSLLTPLNTLPSERINLDLITSMIILFGFAVKLGQFPLHSWLPIVHGKAPSHISALLSGLIIKMGAYAFFLSSQMFTFNPIAFYVLLVQGLISTIYGSFGAIIQTNIKWILAYSSIGYGGIITTLYSTLMILGMNTLRPIIIAVIVFHALTKALAFTNTGLIYQISNTYDIYKLGYLYYVSREGALSAYVALLNMTGIPPSAGFIVKILLITISVLLSMENPLGLPLTVAIVLSAIFSIAYSAKFIGAYLSTLPQISPRAIPIPKMELAAELYMSFASLLAPAVLMMYMLNLFTYGQAVVAVTLPIYIASLVTSIIVFTHILREPRMPEDIKYWLSGVDG
ncbi:MAG: proton-conducting transporter membrane subunit [Desulfurococcaceae archaeon]